MMTSTCREQGPPTSCDQCSEGPIYGFDVVDTDHGIHRVLCADCARAAVETDADVCIECEGSGVVKVAMLPGLWANCEDCPPDAMTPAQVAEAAIHGALRIIQEHFDTDGGYASMYFDDSRPDSDWATMQKILTRYAKAEASHE